MGRDGIIGGDGEGITMKGKKMKDSSWGNEQDLIER